MLSHQGSQSLRAPSSLPSWLWSAPPQIRPPPPSSLCTGPQAPGTTSSPWEAWATCRLARAAAAGAWGAWGPHAAAWFPPHLLFLFSVLLSCRSLTRLFAGLPCWTVRRRAQESPTRPRWRDLLCNPSPLKVSVLKVVLRLPLLALLPHPDWHDITISPVQVRPHLSWWQQQVATVTLRTRLCRAATLTMTTRPPPAQVAHLHATLTVFLIVAAFQSPLELRRN